ncbi:hypothetical protein COB21_05590 [Candidatus Aerophobetes bacterium]|uniref:Uncharacterized protein n=1 Tax=Aerophobetes bacterium TaxID=2030807 RepID=A0A2A4WYF4_UNCAE|nr:MAG: hypothetical protein COB21_05590 [Candidatus Aerophobetes bacterium]
MGIEEISGDIEATYDVSLKEEALDRSLNQSNLVEKVNRAFHSRLCQFENWSYEGFFELFSFAVWTKGMWQSNPATYLVGKVMRVVLSPLAPLLTLARWGYSPVNMLLSYFSSEGFFYSQGEKRKLKPNLDNFVHWNVDLYYHPEILSFSQELPFTDRVNDVADSLRKQNSDVVFLSHVDRRCSTLLYDKLKDNYTDFFLDIGEKAGWSIDAGMFIASRVNITKAPEFVVLDLRKEYNYYGGVLFFETEKQLFLLTNLPKGPYVFMQNLRAKFFEEVANVLIKRNEESPIDKEIFIVGDLSFEDSLEIEKLQVSTSQKGVKLEGGSAFMRVFLTEKKEPGLDQLGPKFHHNSVSHRYATVNLLDTFSLASPDIAEEEQLIVEKGFVKEEGKPLVKPEEKATDKPLSDEDYDQGLLPLETDKESRVERDFTESGKREEVHQPWIEQDFTESGKREETQKSWLENDFTESGKREEVYLPRIERDFTESGKREEDHQPWVERDFTESGKREDVHKPWAEKDFTESRKREEGKESWIERDFIESGKREEAQKSWTEKDFTESGKREEGKESWTEKDFIESGKREEAQKSWTEKDFTESGKREEIHQPWTESDFTESGKREEIPEIPEEIPEERKVEKIEQREESIPLPPIQPTLPTPSEKKPSVAKAPFFR